MKNAGKKNRPCSSHEIKAIPSSLSELEHICTDRRSKEEGMAAPDVSDSRVTTSPLNKIRISKWNDIANWGIQRRRSKETSPALKQRLFASLPLVTLKMSNEVKCGRMLSGNV